MEKEDIVFENKPLYNNKLKEFIEKTLEFNEQYMKFLKNKKQDLIRHKEIMEKNSNG